MLQARVKAFHSTSVILATFDSQLRKVWSFGSIKNIYFSIVFVFFLHNTNYSSVVCNFTATWIFFFINFNSYQQHIHNLFQGIKLFWHTKSISVKNDYLQKKKLMENSEWKRKFRDVSRSLHLGSYFLESSLQRIPLWDFLNSFLHIRLTRNRFQLIQIQE